MTVEEAVQRAEEFRTGCHAFLAYDCGDRWAIFFEEDCGHLDGFPVFVFKAALTKWLKEQGDW